jgi:hypothetical protein
MERAEGHQTQTAHRLPVEELGEVNAAVGLKVREFVAQRYPGEVQFENKAHTLRPQHLGYLHDDDDNDDDDACVNTRSGQTTTMMARVNARDRPACRSR